MLQIVIQVLAGLGLGFLWDKVIPAPTPPATDYRTGIASWGPLKIGLLAVVLIIGAFLSIFLGRKLKLFKPSR